MSRGPSPSTPSRETIELTIPARPEYVVVVRLAAAGIAGRMGFSFDEVEDLKIAVAEACTDAILAGAGPIQVRFGVDSEALEVQVDYAAPRAVRSEERELGLFLIRCLMDEVVTHEEAGRRRMRMTKRVGPAPPAHLGPADAGPADPGPAPSPTDAN
ncbi:MAG: ATP-binding protein [Armatimonadota bacterium]|nr:ATP-binding protein [Armatimonadota bacterium]MDR7447575.1 ATP-binding protein [Armatimonadota bacterium]MDR7458741.1 ATP-binding protein [Armatimonadota bacterium]MDR7480522.1 ATP-binding protein [Armatimonadota bacterium]MDR7489331.1 ATP-binding protein [Armatimonadota bacterium]